MDIQWYESPNSDTTLILSITRRSLSFNKAFANLLSKERRVKFGLDKDNKLIVKIVDDDKDGRKLGASNNLGFMSSRDFENWLNNIAKVVPGKYKLIRLDGVAQIYKAEKIE